MLVLQNKKVRQHKARQTKHKAKRGKTGQDRTRPDATKKRQDATRQDKTRQDEAAQDKARPANARQGEADKQASWATLSCLVGHFGFFLKGRGPEQSRQRNLYIFLKGLLDKEAIDSNQQTSKKPSTDNKEAVDSHQQTTNQKQPQTTTLIMYECVWMYVCRCLCTHSHLER